MSHPGESVISASSTSRWGRRRDRCRRGGRGQLSLIPFKMLGFRLAWVIPRSQARGRSSCDLELLPSLLLTRLPVTPSKRWSLPWRGCWVWRQPDTVFLDDVTVRWPSPWKPNPVWRSCRPAAWRKDNRVLSRAACCCCWILINWAFFYSKGYITDSHLPAQGSKK